MSMDLDEQREKEEDEELDEYLLAFEALELEALNEASVMRYNEMLLNDRTDDVAVKVKEKCIYKVAKHHSGSTAYSLNDSLIRTLTHSLTEGTKNFNNLLNILKANNQFFSVIPKAKTAKIVRNILNIVDTIPSDTTTVQISLCKDIIEWCKVEKRTFLRQRIEAKLANLFLISKETTAALGIINDLLRELKKLDDKQMLTEAHLTESRVYHALQNIPKAKAALTASRTAANSIYVAPQLQAELDEMNGVLHCEEGDYVTSFSYFLEAFDAYDQCTDKRAVVCLKYMALSKVLNNAAHEVPALFSGKLGVKHAGPDVNAMSAIARSAKSRSLEDFKKAVHEHSSYLKSDDLISHHLDLLYDKMLESNILKVIHPFSAVEIHHVAKLINLPVDAVEKKLSQMILDHKFSGILDQGKGHLIIYDTTGSDDSFKHTIEVIANMNNVVEALAGTAKNINKANSVKEKESVKKDEPMKTLVSSDKSANSSPSKKE